MRNRGRCPPPTAQRPTPTAHRPLSTSLLAGLSKAEKKELRSLNARIKAAKRGEGANADIQPDANGVDKKQKKKRKKKDKWAVPPTAGQ